MKIIYKEEIKQIIDELIKLKPSIILIDGEDGVGKTTIISPMIVSILKARTFSVDNYLNAPKDGYLDFIDCEKLKKDILSEKTVPIIIEGVMSMLIMEKLGLKPDYSVYVCSQIWYDDWMSDNGNYSKSFNDVVSQTEEKINIIHNAINPNSKWTLSGLRREIFKFTYDNKPFERASSVLIM